MRSWYNAMIKGVSADNSEAILVSPSKGKMTEEEDVGDQGEQMAIDLHYQSNRCILCGTKSDEGVPPGMLIFCY